MGGRRGRPGMARDVPEPEPPPRGAALLRAGQPGVRDYHLGTQPWGGDRNAPRGGLPPPQRAGCAHDDSGCAGVWTGECDQSGGRLPDPDGTPADPLAFRSVLVYTLQLVYLVDGERRGWG